MAHYTDCKGLPLGDSDSSFGLAEKDIERSGLVVGQKPGLRERTNILRKQFNGSVLLTMVVLIIFAISCFKGPKLVCIHENLPINSPTSFPHIAPSDEVITATWVFKAWNTSNTSTLLSGCSGAPIVDLSGTVDQNCTEAPSAFAEITWIANQQFVLCLFNSAGCDDLAVEYKTDQTCQDGHKASSFKIVAAGENCTSSSSIMAVTAKE